MDVLSDILKTLRLKAEIFMHACFRGDWAIDSSGEHRATFHMVSRGSCWLHVPGNAEPEALSGGDLVVFPHDSEHMITNFQHPPGDELVKNIVPEGIESGPSTTIICGYFEFESHNWNPLLDSLPEVMIIRSEDSASTPLMDSVGRFLQFELETGQVGSSLLIDKLSEVLFVYVLRNYISSGVDQGFVLAMADPQIGKALMAIHEDPASQWTVESLAKTAGMSRSAFSDRFGKLVQLSPVQYLTHWRMNLAIDKFKTSDDSVAQVAEQSGYLSEAAFAKAFKKYFGFGPGKARRDSFI